MKQIVLFFLAVVFIHEAGAQNLVPNASFEEYTNCPDADGQLSRCQYWQNGTSFSTCDYFNACDLTGLVGVPANFNGWSFQLAKTGNAYAGLIALMPSLSPEDSYEYLSIALSDSLKAGKSYFVSCYMNCTDNTSYVIATLGMLLSNSLNFSMDGHRINEVPNFESSTMLSDTVNWIQLYGMYTAQGDEKFLTIGNFKSRLQSSFTSTGMNGLTGSYYFIDDVCISQNPADCGLDTSLLNVTGKIDRNYPLRVFPNPALESVTVDYALHNSRKGKIVLEIADELGRIVYSQQLPTEAGFQKIDVQGMSKGLYHVYVKQPGAVLSVSKFLKQ